MQQKPIVFVPSSEGRTCRDTRAVADFLWRNELDGLTETLPPDSARAHQIHESALHAGAFKTGTRPRKSEPYPRLYVRKPADGSVVWACAEATNKQLHGMKLLVKGLEKPEDGVRDALDSSNPCA